MKKIIYSYRNHEPSSSKSNQ